jgi:hypothetical protein
MVSTTASVEEYKRFMHVSVELEADFSRGCAGKRIDPLLFATHPYPALRRWFYISPACPVVLGAVNLYSLLQYLVPSKKQQCGE